MDHQKKPKDIAHQAPVLVSIGPDSSASRCWQNNPEDNNSKKVVVDADKNGSDIISSGNSSMKPGISFCISCKNRSNRTVYWDGKFRNECFENIPAGQFTLKLLPNCLKSVYKSKIEEVNFEVIISDFSSQDTKYEDWINDVLKEVPYKILNMGSTFNKGKGLNAAANASSGEILFFLDTDMLISKALINQALKILCTKKAFFPVCKSYKDPLHSNYWIRDSGYGNLIILKNFFGKCGFWLEREVYGWEDDEMWYRLKEFAQREPGIDFFHQWHPVGNDTDSYGGQFSRENYRYDLPAKKNSKVFRELNIKARNNPLISIFIFCPEDVDVIERNIFALKMQTYSNFEIIIISHGLTDQEYIIPKKYPEVRIVGVVKRNRPHGYNVGMQIAHGEYFIFLQPTEFLYPHALETSIKYFINYPECALVTGISDKNSDKIENQSRIKNADDYVSLLYRNDINSISLAMFRKEIFEYIGLFDEKLNDYAHYDMILRVARKYTIFKHDDIISRNAQHNVINRDDVIRKLKEIKWIYRKQKYYLYSDANKKNIKTNEPTFAREVGIAVKRFARKYGRIIRKEKYCNPRASEILRAIKFGKAAAVDDISKNMVPELMNNKKIIVRPG